MSSFLILVIKTNNLFLIGESTTFGYLKTERETQDTLHIWNLSMGIGVEVKSRNEKKYVLCWGGCVLSGTHCSIRISILQI